MFHAAFLAQGIAAGIDDSVAKSLPTQSRTMGVS